MKILNRTEAAEKLGMTPLALSSHVSRGNWDAVPKPIKIGRCNKWVAEVIDEWILERLKESKCETPQKKKRGPGRPPKERSASC